MLAVEQKMCFNRLGSWSVNQYAAERKENVPFPCKQIEEDALTQTTTSKQVQGLEMSPQGLVHSA